MRPPTILIALLPLAACTQGPQPVPPERVAAAEATGAPRSCVPTTQINDTRVRDDRTIDFRMAGGRYYRNTLPDSCPELGFEERFGYKVSTSQLCSTDVITVLHSDGSRGASCGLGEFVPIAPPPPPARR